MGEFRYIYSEELYHHGIQGQKWGIRRFQNKDGSLTSAGRKRRGFIGTVKQMRTKHKRKVALKKARKTREENKKKQEELEKLKAEYRKSPKALLDHQELFSDEEIRAANARFNLLNDTKKERLDSINKYMDTGKKVFDTLNSAATVGKTLSEIYKNLPHEDNSEVGKLKREAEILKAKGDIQRNKNGLEAAKEARKKTLYDKLKEETNIQEQRNKLAKAQREGEDLNPLSYKSMEDAARKQIAFNKSQIDLDDSNKSYDERFNVKTGNTGGTGSTGSTGKTGGKGNTGSSKTGEPRGKAIGIRGMKWGVRKKSEASGPSNSKKSRSAWDDIKESVLDKGFVKTTKLPNAAKTTPLLQNRTKDITSDSIRKGVSKYGMTKYNDVGRYVGNDKTDQVLRDFMASAHSMPISEINSWLNSH